MKKFVSLFLVAVLCIAVLPLQAFAAVSDEHVDEPKGHTHVFPLEDTQYRDEYRTYENSSSKHQVRTRYSIKCRYCTEEFIWHSNWKLENHGSSILYNATCNGSQQTLYYHCRNCKGNNTTDDRACPGGPHSGGCNYLPI